MQNKTPIYIFLLTLALAVIHILFFLPELPEVVDSGFNVEGEPITQMDRGLFVTIYAVILLVVAGIFFGVSSFIRKSPTSSLVHFPKKEYWLAPERRDATISDLTTRLFWFGSATVIFIIGIMHMAFRTNIEQTETLGAPFWIIFIAYIGFTYLWTAKILRRYKKTS